MGRPKLYSSGAQKQAAYRARLEASTAVVDRQALDHLRQRSEALQEAVSVAARRGDPLARRCVAASVETVLEKVTAAFQERQECSEKGT
jgi:hypothetical protein